MCEDNSKTVVEELIENARGAMEQIKNYNQEQTDELVQAVAWAIYKEDHAKNLAEIAVENSGFGNVKDKIIKNQRKTFGALNDLLGAKSVGVINVDKESGITEIAKPVGVVAAIVPSTNPGATPANKSMMAVKGRNAIILAPSPAGATTCAKLLEYIHEEFDKIGAPRELVQMIPMPVSKEKTAELMKQADLVTVTGSARNVKNGQSSGTPNVCVSEGNVVSIVDSTADLAKAASLIIKSKTFDNSTSCSADNAIVLEDSIYDKMIEEFKKQGVYFCNAEEKVKLQKAMWDEETGRRRTQTVAKGVQVMAEEAGFESEEAKNAKFFLVEEEGIGKEFLFSGEKLALVAAVYRARDFNHALEITKGILNFQGRGHSCGLHTTDESHIEQIGLEMDVCRLLINQAQCFGNGGSFDNGLNFTLSMGGGTWAGNNIGENLSYKHFINITKVSRVIPEVVPEEQELFGSYWERYGK